MEQETLFTSSKWDILKALESGKKSPIDLAKESKTSVANISQQLRLLELAGFVKSERISNREKGLPRILYSLAGNYSYHVVSSKNFVDKKFLKLEEYQRCIMRIWFIENAQLRYYLEKFFWSIDRQIEKMEYLGVDITESSSIKIVIITENADVKKAVKEISIEGNYGLKHVTVNYIKDLDLKKNAGKYYTIYDRSSI